MYINPILKDILKSKRPTNNEAFCTAFTTNLLTSYGIDYEVDIHNNITVDMGGESCFTSHTDTVDKHLGINILHIENGIVSIQGGGVLGADCGSGMYIMIRMILAGVRGLYVFFASEERGRIGSSKYGMPNDIKRCVSFDRKGTEDLITHQSGERGCSEAFADAFVSKFALPFKKDPTGVFTDSYTFFGIVPECINLSVGYYAQHTQHETQDLVFLESLVDACITMDWESLPTERDPTKIEYLPYERPATSWWRNSKYGGFYGSVYDDEGDYYAGFSKNGKTNAVVEDDDDEMLDFVWNNAEVVASYIEEWGITVGDLIAYKQALLLDEDDDADVAVH